MPKLLFVKCSKVGITGKEAMTTYFLENRNESYNRRKTIILLAIENLHQKTTENYDSRRTQRHSKESFQHGRLHFLRNCCLRSFWCSTKGREDSCKRRFYKSPYPHILPTGEKRLLENPLPLEDGRIMRVVERGEMDIKSKGMMWTYFLEKAR